MNLPISLAHLESSDLVRQVREEDLAYLFKHVLVQDTAQESLLKNERKRLHRIVAETLETLYADRLDEFATRLFQHYDAAGLDAKTTLYAERAGEAAMRISAYDEAGRAFARALELASQQTDNSARQIRLMTRLGRVYELQVRYDDALALYKASRDTARERHDNTLELAALVQIATIYAVGSVKYDPGQARQVAEQALALANAAQDQHAEAKILWTMMLSNLYGAGGASAGVGFGERSLALARQLNWREQLAYTLNDLFYIYLNLGELTRAREYVAEARELWRELDNKPMLSDNLNAAAMAHIMRGQVAAADELLQENLALCQTIGNRWGEATAHMIQGTGAAERGDLAQARTSFELCMKHGDSIGIKGQAVMARFGLARVCAYLGDLDRALGISQDALERTNNYALDWHAWAHATMAYVQMARGDWDAAEASGRAIGDAPPEFFFERILPAGAFHVVQTQILFELRAGDWKAAHAHLERLLERLRKSDFQIFLPTALNMLAQGLISQHQFGKARAVLAEASTLAEQMDLRTARFEIALTYLDLGDAAVEQARYALDALLETVPPDLQMSFMSTERVQRVVSYA